MEFIEHLKASVEIAAVIGEYVRLKRVGSTPRYIGLCPFHTEKTPSFTVHSSKGFYKCFGCGEGGDVIKFVQEIERLSFWEAVTLLAERNGIPLPKRADYSDEESRRKGRLLEMQDIAARHFQDNLFSPAGREAMEYLARRGVSSSIAQEFLLGLSDRGGQTLFRILERRGFDPAEMEAAGLVLKRQDGSGYFDRFRGRLMFPIHSESAKVIGFGGRALASGDEPKYLNTAETPVYAKSHVLYNLHRAKDGIRKSGRVVLVEGYMDVIGVYAAGVKEVVATCGTALTNFQVRAMKRHSDQIVVNFDPDAAGANATERSIQVLIEEAMRVRVLQLEGGLDPDEYIQKQGMEAYQTALGNARGYFHWLADRARGRFDMKSAEGRVAVFQFLLPAIQRMPEKLERLAVANDLASYLGVEAGFVLDEFRRAAAERREQKQAMKREALPPPNELLLFHGLLSNAEARGRIHEQLKILGVTARFRAAALFETALRIMDAGQEPTFGAIEARLQEKDRELLYSLGVADELAGDVPSTEQCEECLKAVEQEERGRRRAELRAQVKAAERSGDLAGALKLMEELQRWERAV